MKEKMIAKNKEHLQQLIQNEIEMNGIECDLNHIDISQVTDLSNLFEKSEFNGDISKWKPYSLKTVSAMFMGCNQDLKPYWLNYGRNDQEQRNKAIDAYHLFHKINSKLEEKNIPNNRMKI